MRPVSLRLTHRITAIGFIGLMGVLLVGGIHFYGENAVALYRGAAENARNVAELNRRIEVELLEGRRAEKDFLLRNDTKKADSQIEISKAVAADIEMLRNKVRAVGKPQLVVQIESMQTSLQKYQAHFANVVQQKRELGLDEKSGLEGRLRDSVHNIETRVEVLREQSLLIILLTMRRNEKDFMLRRDAKYGDEMLKRNAEFIAAIEQAGISDAAKTELKQKLVDYQRDFQAWMAQALTLATELKSMSEAFSAVEPVIEAIEKSVFEISAEAEQSNRAERASIERLIVIAIVLIAALVMGAGWFIGRSVSKPLKAMTAAMMELASGNFAIVLPGLGRRDEMGEIAQAVETFKVNAEQKARDEAEEKLRQDQIAAQQRKADMIRMADAFEDAVGEIVETVSSASTELEASADALTATATRSQQLSTMVAAASEEASTNVYDGSQRAYLMSSKVQARPVRLRHTCFRPPSRCRPTATASSLKSASS